MFAWSRTQSMHLIYKYCTFFVLKGNLLQNEQAYFAGGHNFFFPTLQNVLRTDNAILVSIPVISQA